MTGLVDILKAVAVVGGVSALLALLLAVADALVANYGVCTITINDDRKLKVEGGEPLLATLMSQGIFIPSACGGRGSCAYCKVKVLDGGGPLLPTERPLLTAEEIDAGVRLSCQCKVRNDMALEIPEELFNIREYRAVVERLTDLTHDCKGVRIRLVEPDEIRFRAGQYVQLRSEPYGDVKDEVYRAYSVASAPAETGAVELIVRLVPDGIMTTYVFEHLREGAEVVLNGPYGEFYLREGDARPVFIAGGSGIAPIRSILLDTPDEVARRGGIFFFGAREKRDLVLLDEMREFAEAHTGYEYVPALSAPAEGDGWDGETGLITEVLDRRLESVENVEAYLCGSPGMIDACIEVLKGKGLAEELIFYDKFA